MEGLTHLFELAVLVELVDVCQQGPPLCILQLEDADQRLHKTGGALGEDPDCTGLQLLQPWAALETRDPASARGVSCSQGHGTWCWAGLTREVRHMQPCACGRGLEAGTQVRETCGCWDAEGQAHRPRSDGQS